MALENQIPPKFESRRRRKKNLGTQENLSAHLFSFMPCSFKGCYYYFKVVICLAMDITWCSSMVSPGLVLDVLTTLHSWEEGGDK